LANHLHEVISIDFKLEIRFKYHWHDPFPDPLNPESRSDAIMRLDFKFGDEDSEKILQT
jgi:hypothetical protein